MSNKPVILLFVAHYLPGYKSGGPVRSISNLVNHLKEEYLFKIVTMGNDFNSNINYPDIKLNSWITESNPNLYYINNKNNKLYSYVKIINESECDIIYINSFFSFRFSIIILMLRKFGLISKVPIILAPRGEFSIGALKLKKPKKKLFISISKMFGLHRNIKWQASNIYEKKDIISVLGPNSNINIAGNAPPKIIKELGEEVNRKKKIKGRLSIIFLSRISRKKNLDFALDLLSNINGRVALNIYGIIEDVQYWNECQDIVKVLPQNIIVNYRGELQPENVMGAFKMHDLFLFPTLGENFGHVLLESLCAGCPLLISDQTPWKNLYDLGVGWDISLSNENMFVKRIQQFVDMDDSEYIQYSLNSKRVGHKYINNNFIIDQNRTLFNTSIEKN